MTLHSAQDAIKQAIEGGWNEISRVDFAHETSNETLEYRYDDSVFLDPLFWQALGKARGWGEQLLSAHNWTKLTSGEKEFATNQESLRRAKMWFETRLPGGDETKFWQSLP